MFFLGLNVLEDLLLNKKLILISWTDYLEVKLIRSQVIVCKILSAESRVWLHKSQSVNFLVGSSGAAHECSLQFSLPLLPEVRHNPETQLIYVIHCLLGILAAQELHISKSLR